MISYMQELTIHFNNSEVFSHLRSGIRSYLHQSIPSNPTIIEVAFNEAVNNAVKHSKNAGNPTVTVAVRVKERKRLLIRVKDQGCGFPAYETMNRLNDAYSQSLPDELLMKESGRGLMIMNQVMDKVIYNKQGNEVLLMKRL
ncbi:ATP-binding protein [Bacillus ectoiniformans]|uniref:ATP-binding protein n=1 Tax=Bacillus ectoiniformans TaxID=1494429 RepID=UPI0019569C5E